MWKLPEFFIRKFSFYDGKILNIFEQACFNGIKAGLHDAFGKTLEQLLRNHITKTRLFKYIENSMTKNWKFSDKNSIFLISAQKHILWVLVKTR